MHTASDFIIGAMVAVFGVIGLVLVSGAVDNGVYIFGLSLFGFACLFNFGLVRAHFDRRDTARVRAAENGGSGHV